MSASLVGSEMCIRDSLSSCAAALHITRRFRAASAAGGGAGAAPDASPEAVSYTHLTLPTICSV
eukprot:14307112-Alexandrium_andersonii.AAC.1